MHSLQVVDAADLLNEVFSLFDAIGLETLVTKVCELSLRDERSAFAREI